MKITLMPLTITQFDMLFGENFISEEFIQLVLKVVKRDIDHKKLYMIDKLLLTINRSRTFYEVDFKTQKLKLVLLEENSPRSFVFCWKPEGDHMKIYPRSENINFNEHTFWIEDLDYDAMINEFEVKASYRLKLSNFNINYPHDIEFTTSKYKMIIESDDDLEEIKNDIFSFVETWNNSNPCKYGLVEVIEKTENNITLIVDAGETTEKAYIKKLQSLNKYNIEKLWIKKL